MLKTCLHHQIEMYKLKFSNSAISARLSGKNDAGTLVASGFCISNNFDIYSVEIDEPAVARLLLNSALELKFISKTSANKSKWNICKSKFKYK